MLRAKRRDWRRVHERMVTARAGACVERGGAGLKLGIARIEQAMSPGMKEPSGEDHRLPPAAADEPVEDDRLEKRQA